MLDISPFYNLCMIKQMPLCNRCQPDVLRVASAEKALISSLKMKKILFHLSDNKPQLTVWPTLGSTVVIITLFNFIQQIASNLFTHCMFFPKRNGWSFNSVIVFFFQISPCTHTQFSQLQFILEIRRQNTLHYYATH